jgi:hypothetical protein
MERRRPAPVDLATISCLSLAHQAAAHQSAVMCRSADGGETPPLRSGEDPDSSYSSSTIAFTCRP